MGIDKRGSIVANKICELLKENDYSPGEGMILLIGTCVGLSASYAVDMASRQGAYAQLRAALELYIEAMECADDGDLE